MSKVLKADTFFSQSRNRLIVDVRSPSEYLQGHIPGAVSLPLFDDCERAEIGTLYKQVSREAAVRRGLEMVAPRMAGYIDTIKDISSESIVFMYCWRGGMRSGFMSNLFSLFSYEVYLLEGGYKSYRNEVLTSMMKPYSLRVISGYTGSRKTEILQSLRNHGECIIDLEYLAKHKGSAFGHLGMKEQGSCEQFENDLHDALKAVEGSKNIWLEDESRSIGKVHLPQEFFKQMQSAPCVFIDVNFDERVDYLLEFYGKQGVEALADSAVKTSKRMGPQHVKHALELLQAGETRAFIAEMLKYYDKTYLHSFSRRTHTEEKKLEVSGKSVNEICSILIREYGIGTRL